MEGKQWGVDTHTVAYCYIRTILIVQMGLPRALLLAPFLCVSVFLAPFIPSAVNTMTQGVPSTALLCHLHSL